MKYLKSLLILATLACTFSASYAQNTEKTLEKLRVLLDEEKYFKVEYKCYDLSEDYVMKREPLMWLYFSMSSYEISTMEADQNEDYPTAYKDAVKYAIKYVQKDRKKLVQEAGKEHLALITDLVWKDADAFYAEENYKKARLQYKSLTKLNKEDLMAWFKKAASEKQLKFASEARNTMMHVMKKENAAATFAKLSAEDQALLQPEYDTIAAAQTAKAEAEKSNP